MAAKKPLTSIRYNGNADFQEVSLDREDSRGNECLAISIREALGGGVISLLSSPFFAPFALAVDENGHHRHAPTAIIVEPASSTGTNALFGPALFFRKTATSLVSVREGDIERVRGLPFWVRFDRLERRASIPRADDIDRPFAPQVAFFVRGTHHELNMFFNWIVGRYEFDILAVNYTHIGEAVRAEFMLDDDAKAEELIRSLPDLIDGNGNLRAPWGDA